MQNPQRAESAKTCKKQKKALFLGLLLLLTGYSQQAQTQALSQTLSQPQTISQPQTQSLSQTQPTQTLRIAFLTDIHVSPGAVSEPNLEKIVSEINTGHYDFAVVTGDVSNSGLDTELITTTKPTGPKAPARPSCAYGATIASSLPAALFFSSASTPAPSLKWATAMSKKKTYTG
jgi:hypothetical protein